MSKAAFDFGPRLVGSPTGTLRMAAMVKPTAAIGDARPMHGEPSAVYTRALEQHDILRKTLEYFGVQVAVFEPHGNDPYEVAVADAAVVFEDGAMIMRPTAMSRRGEATRLETELLQIDAPLAGHVVAPGLLDGGDVVLCGRTAFIGTTRRGNAVGRSGFAAIAKAHGFDVINVAVADDVPSLRSVCSAVASDTLVLAPNKVDAAAFSGFKTIELDKGEEMAAGVLTLGEHHVIADVRYRTSLQRMRKSGLVVEGIDVYDFEKAGITLSMLALALKRD